MKITITLPDEVARKVCRLPNPDEFVARAVETALGASGETGAPEVKPSRWARLVERIEREDSPGLSAEEWGKSREGFRGDFRFSQDES